MVDRFRVNTASLEKLSADLRSVGTSLKGLSGAVHDVKGDIDHQQVEQAMNDFEDDWNVARGKMVADIMLLSRAWRLAAQQFKDVDSTIELQAGRFGTPFWQKRGGRMR